eukprot:1138884-Pelagomonas_calceolata.AAC.10
MIESWVIPCMLCCAAASIEAGRNLLHVAPIRDAGGQVGESAASMECIWVPLFTSGFALGLPAQPCKVCMLYLHHGKQTSTIISQLHVQRFCMDHERHASSLCSFTYAHMCMQVAYYIGVQLSMNVTDGSSKSQEAPNVASTPVPNSSTCESHQKQSAGDSSCHNEGAGQQELPPAPEPKFSDKLYYSGVTGAVSCLRCTALLAVHVACDSWKQEAEDGRTWKAALMQ